MRKSRHYHYTNNTCYYCSYNSVCHTTKGSSWIYACILNYNYLLDSYLFWFERVIIYIEVTCKEIKLLTPYFFFIDDCYFHTEPPQFH